MTEEGDDGDDDDSLSLATST